MSRQARMTRTAISPRLAIRIFLIRQNHLRFYPFDSEFSAIRAEYRRAGQAASYSRSAWTMKRLGAEPT